MKPGKTESHAIRLHSITRRDVCTAQPNVNLKPKLPSMQSRGETSSFSVADPFSPIYHSEVYNTGGEKVVESSRVEYAKDPIVIDP